MEQLQFSQVQTSDRKLDYDHSSATRVIGSTFDHTHATPGVIMTRAETDIELVYTPNLFMENTIETTLPPISRQPGPRAGSTLITPHQQRHISLAINETQSNFGARDTFNDSNTEIQYIDKSEIYIKAELTEDSRSEHP